MNILSISKKYLLHSLSVGVFLATAIASGRATAVQIVFDGGLPNLKSANEASAWVQAEDFLINTARTITGVNFWSLETPRGWNGNSNNGWDGTIRYSVFRDAGGRPDTSPIVGGNATNIVRNATGRSYSGSSLQLDEYAYSFDFNAPINVAANTTYWLGLNLASSYNDGQVENRNNVYWGSTSNNFGSNGMESFNGDYNNWNATRNQHAFQLTSQSENVPEPVTILGTLAAVGFGTALRRRYQKQQSRSH